MRRIIGSVALVCASAVLPACSGDSGTGPGPSTQPPAAGSLTITTLTTGVDLDSDGYFCRLDGGAEGLMGINETVTLTGISVGAHSVELLDVAQNCQISGTNPRSVDVTAGATASITFDVACTEPEPVSQIAFASDRTGTGDFDIYLVNVDGSGLIDLTDSFFHERAPAWSPDGTRIAFVSENPYPGWSVEYLGSEIHVMNADGTGSINLTNDRADDSWPVWSPDGAKIAFLSNRGCEDGCDDLDLFVMNSDGSEVVRLTDDTEQDGMPKWAPDGSRIVFVKEVGSQSEVFVVNADGSDLTRLTHDANTTYADDLSPTWSPDGSRILFATGRDGNGEVYTMSPDGTGARNLTNRATEEWWAEWSPDGASIAFISTVAEADYELHVMNADGSGSRLITGQLVSWRDARPAWSSDGSYLAFVGDATGNEEVYVIRSDGTGLMNLTSNFAEDAAPAWRPEP